MPKQICHVCPADHIFQLCLFVCQHPDRFGDHGFDKLTGDSDPGVFCFACNQAPELLIVDHLLQIISAHGDPDITLDDGVPSIHRLPQVKIPDIPGIRQEFKVPDGMVINTLRHFLRDRQPGFLLIQILPFRLRLLCLQFLKKLPEVFLFNLSQKCANQIPVRLMSVPPVTVSFFPVS